MQLAAGTAFATVLANRMTTGAHQLAADFDQVPAANWASGPGCARLGIPILRLLF
jgi:hypothetical protein